MRTLSMVLALITLLVFSGGAMAKGGPRVPADIVRDSVEIIHYDGVSDDLLSGGLNADGLQSNVEPGFADPLTPTPAELRRRAIYTNFRAITDMTTAGGYGLFWGPGSDLELEFEGATPGLIPGVEYKALIKGGRLHTLGAAVGIKRILRRNCSGGMGTVQRLCRGAAGKSHRHRISPPRNRRGL